uniref:Uncharacterized protein n=1 Tax=Anguilla anguilla TaxID=7936 RepID=A0A0E9U601_ANGAN
MFLVNRRGLCLFFRVFPFFSLLVLSFGHSCVGLTVCGIK